MLSKECVSAVKDGRIKAPANKTKRVAYLSSSGASKKHKLTDSISVELVKDLKYLVDADKPFLAKVNFNFQADALALLKEYLDETQISMFKVTCFSRFLDMELIIGQPQLVHSLVLREIDCYKKDEMWFSVCSRKLKFGIEEFAIVMGLKCHGDSGRKVPLNFNGQLMNKYFVNSKASHKILLVESV